MKQPVTQRKLIINNRKFSYFITLLKNKFLVSQLASKNIPKCIAIIFVLMLAITETFLRLVLVAVNYSNFNCKCFLTLRGATSFYFSLHMRVNVSFISGLYCLDIGGTHCIGNESMPTIIT